MLELMYRAGLRVGEVCQLRPRDVDLAGGTIRIEDGKGGDGTAYIDAETVRPLFEQWKRVRRQLAAARVDAPLFCTLAGRPVSVRCVEQMVGRMKRRAGITSACTPHVLRHTFATNTPLGRILLPRGPGSPRHADVSTTIVYTHALDSQLRERSSAAEPGRILVPNGVRLHV